MTALAGRVAAQARGVEGRIVLLISVLLGFESVLYSTVAPILPHYAHEFGASKPAIGVLAASYPAGMIPGSLLGGWIATRAGVRRTTMVGLLMFTVSIIPYGFATDMATLDLLRFVQGAACGCIWSGGLAWVIALAPRERRGEVLGSVMAAAIFGTLLGPVVGTLAVAVGTEIVFTGVGAVSLALAGWTLQHPEPPPPEHERHSPLRALARSPQLILSVWLIVLDAAMIGATATLLPLRLSHLGASGAAIGVTFVLASLLATITSPHIGRLVDRRGPGVPIALGLLVTALLIATLPLPSSALGLAGLTVIALGGTSTVLMLPSMSVITGTADRLGVAIALATMVLNLGWAAGEALGAPTAATIAHLTSDTVALLLISAAMLATLLVVLGTGLIRNGPQPASLDASPAERAAADDEDSPSSHQRIPLARS
jgi:predicted MFS family arabinose efflux permease